MKNGKPCKLWKVVEENIYSFDIDAITQARTSMRRKIASYFISYKILYNSFSRDLNKQVAKLGII